MSKDREKTHLTAKFYVMSMLHRKGVNPFLITGNKKVGDIIIAQNDDTYLTIDVKGALRPLMPLIKYEYRKSDTHYYVFVCYMGKFGDMSVTPEVYIVPSKDIGTLVKKNPEKRIAGIAYKKFKERAQKYKDRWDVFV